MLALDSDNQEALEAIREYALMVYHRAILNGLGEIINDPIVNP